MDAKTVKRILYGVFAAALLVVGARELAASGFTPTTIFAGGVGLILLFNAITGHG